MAAPVGFFLMEQVVPIIHNVNIYKHTLVFIWPRFVLFFPPRRLFYSLKLLVYPIFWEVREFDAKYFKCWVFRGEIIFNSL